MQFENRRPIWLIRGEHAGDLRHHAALPEIAGCAGRDDVVPSRLTATGTRDEMVERQIAFVAAVLTGEAVAQKNIEAREGWIERRLHVRLQRDNARQLKLE